MAGECLGTGFIREGGLARFQNFLRDSRKYRGDPGVLGGSSITARQHPGVLASLLLALPQGTETNTGHQLSRAELVDLSEQAAAEIKDDVHALPMTPSLSESTIHQCESVD